MLYIEVLLLAIGLSMDSLAVSVTGGAVLKNNCTAGNIIKIASVLGIFQAGMTVIGYTMGLGFEKYICAFDHWIAFTLLLYLGGKMIYDSTKEEEEDGKFDPLCNRTLCGLGIATSIDALAAVNTFTISHLCAVHFTFAYTGIAANAFDIIYLDPKIRKFIK